MQAMETLSQSSRRRVVKAQGWQFWIDRGGTFTDVIGLSPAGELHVRKVLSASAGAAAGDPGLRAARAILAAAGAAPRAVAAVKVGTTVATNALLTRSGEPVVLVTSAGFADALRIAYQNRPDIFARHIVLPEPLYTTVIAALVRLDHGRVQGLGQHDVAREDVGSILVGDAQRIGEAGAGHQHQRLAAAREQRVGRDGGPDLDRRHGTRGGAGGGENRARGAQARVARRGAGARREHLADVQLAGGRE